VFFNLILLFSILLPPLSMSSELGRNWILNKDHSEIIFEIPYLKFGKVTGRFTQFRGQVTYDKDETLIERISIVIFAESINTGNKLRDGHLKGKDFFDVKNFPKITFISNEVLPISPNRFKALGELSIHGVTKDITFKFRLSELIKDTWGKPSIMGEFNGILSRKDFGLTWNKLIENEANLVGDEISFSGQVQLQSRKSLTDSSKHLIPINASLRKRNKILRGEETPDIIKRDILKLDKKNNKLKMINSPKKVDSSHSSTWWLAYFSMGLIGFFSIITLMFQGKQYFINIFSTEYEETGKWGFVSDIIVYSIGLIYVWAMWVIGFSV